MNRYQTHRKPTPPGFPFKKNNYPDYVAKAKTCFEYLKNLDWSSPDRLIINKTPIEAKNLKRFGSEDFTYTCPGDIIGVEIPDEGPVYVTIKSIETDYEHMNIFTDLFMEYARMEANMIGKISPMEFWKKNHKQIMNKVSLAGQELTNYNLREMQYKMFANGRGECTTFRPAILFAIIKMFGAKTVLDPSSGWADRLFACLAADVDLYIGVDPNKRLIKGYTEIRSIFDPTETKSVMVCKGFEDFEMTDVPKNLRIDEVDLVFTSPPYWDMEVYSHESTQSINKFNQEDSWVHGFLFVLFDKAIRYTKIGGHIILNIEMIDTRNTYVYQLIDYAKSKSDQVVYCQMLTYQGSRHSAHAAIFVFKVIGK